MQRMSKALMIEAAEEHFQLLKEYEAKDADDDRLLSIMIARYIGSAQWLLDNNIELDDLIEDLLILNKNKGQ